MLDTARIEEWTSLLLDLTLCNYRRVELVLLHSPDSEPKGTIAWLKARPHLARHHHARLSHPKVPFSCSCCKEAREFFLRSMTDSSLDRYSRLEILYQSALRHHITVPHLGKPAASSNIGTCAGFGKDSEMDGR